MKGRTNPIPATLREVCLAVLAAVILASAAKAQSCGCVQQPSASLWSTANPTQPISGGGTLTILPPQQSTPLRMTGDPHPNMYTNTGVWAASLRYSVNGTTAFGFFPFSGNASSNERVIPAILLTSAINTVKVEAKCTSSGNICTLATFTVSKYINPVHGAVSVTTQCCTTAHPPPHPTETNNGQMKLKMMGSITSGSGFLKVERRTGSSPFYHWVQQGALIPFVAGGFTACYPKMSSMGTIYRMTLVDSYGLPAGTPASVTPAQFTNCPSCCL